MLPGLTLSDNSSGAKGNPGLERDPNFQDTLLESVEYAKELVAMR